MLWENAGHQTRPTVLLLMYGSFHLPWPSLGLYEKWVCKTKNSQGQNCLFLIWPSPHVALVVKNLPVNAGNVRDKGSIPGSGRSPGGGHGNPLQFLCLENPVDRGAWGGYSSQGCKKLDMTEQLSTHSTVIRARSLFLFLEDRVETTQEGHRALAEKGAVNGVSVQCYQ